MESYMDDQERKEKEAGNRRIVAIYHRSSEPDVSEEEFAIRLRYKVDQKYRRNFQLSKVLSVIGIVLTTASLIATICLFCRYRSLAEANQKLRQTMINSGIGFSVFLLFFIYRRLRLIPKNWARISLWKRERKQPFRPYSLVFYDTGMGYLLDDSEKKAVPDSLEGRIEYTSIAEIWRNESILAYRIKELPECLLILHKQYLTEGSQEDLAAVMEAQAGIQAKLI